MSPTKIEALEAMEEAYAEFEAAASAAWAEYQNGVEAARANEWAAYMKATAPTRAKYDEASDAYDKACEHERDAGRPTHEHRGHEPHGSCCAEHARGGRGNPVT